MLLFLTRRIWIIGWNFFLNVEKFYHEHPIGTTDPFILNICIKSNGAWLVYHYLVSEYVNINIDVLLTLQFKLNI